MNREETLTKLKESQDLPHATPEDLWRLPQGKSEEEMKLYLTDFAKPTGKCWLCDNDLIVEWGIQHGIAHCSSCGIDVKMYHYFEVEGRQVRWEASLQTHPKHYAVEEGS